MRASVIPVALILALSACGSPESESDPAASVTPTPTPSVVATAELRTADGEPAGTATATPGFNGVRVALEVTGLPPGEHGVHVHTIGKCDAPSFESAGPHWNPTESTHGLEGERGQHAGDMPNLAVAEDGTGTLNYRLIGGDWDALFDADGAALVVHAMPDDQKTDPSGNSGDRIACGVFAKD